MASTACRCCSPNCSAWRRRQHAMNASPRDHIRTLLLYAQDNRGLGHINRTLTIARHILTAHPDCVAYIATKSHIDRNFTLPERCDYIKLPTRITPRTIQQTEEEEAAGI